MDRSWPAPLASRLEGKRAIVEPLAAEHGPDLYAAAGGDAEVWRWIDPRVAESKEAFDAMLRDALAESAAGREAAFAILDRESGRAVGSTRLLAPRPWDRAIEIGWTWLGRAAWRTGINVEVKRLLLTHAFETLGCRRVELKTDARNRRSRVAIAAVGAHFEGIFRKHRLVPTARDTAWYAIVDDDWPAVRERLDRRLAGTAPPAPAPPAVAHLDDLEEHPIEDNPGLVWRPVRAHFGIRAFGINAYTAAAPGDVVVEDHDESGSGHEELYAVIAGRARFVMAGRDEPLDAPAGTFVHLQSGVQRSATAVEPGTVVLALGGAPGEPFSPSSWEVWFRGLSQLDAGDEAAARETFERGIAEHPDDGAVRYYHAVVLARVGEAERARSELRAALELAPRLAARAEEEEALRGLV